MSFRLASRLMTLDNLELLQVRIFLEFRAISHIWKATTAKRMEIGPRCKRQNCNPLNVFLIDVQISSILLGIPPLGATITIHWAKMAMAAKNACRNLSIFTRATLCIGEMEFSKMKRNALAMPLSATCFVITSNWSNFWHAFASRGFVSDSWAFLFTDLDGG